MQPDPLPRPDNGAEGIQPKAKGCTGIYVEIPRIAIMWDKDFYPCTRPSLAPRRLTDYTVTNNSSRHSAVSVPEQHPHLPRLLSSPLPDTRVRPLRGPTAVRSDSLPSGANYAVETFPMPQSSSQSSQHCVSRSTAATFPKTKDSWREKEKLRFNY